jgi:molecular chaperone GrpE
MKKKPINIKELEKQRDEYLSGWKRAKADFDNYKKQEVERIASNVEYANKTMVLKILEILDNFELVKQNLTVDLQDNDYIKGVLQIKNQIQDFLKNQGVKEVKATGGKFDPNFHEVVEQIEDKNKEAGTIIKIIQKGYELRGRVIRPSRVRITK